MSPVEAPHYDIAIIGAGAAGLTAAIFAGQRARAEGSTLSICLIDGAKKPGAKILVSGGGRCNVTNTSVTENDYCGGSPKIIRNVLRSFDEEATLSWMESLGVPLKLEPTGKYFPESDSARTVLDALMNRIADLGVETRFGFRVGDVQQHDGRWRVINAEDHSHLTANRVIVATGGKALPKSGSDGASYSWLERLGHTVVPPVPALAPLVLSEHGIEGSPLSRYFADLSGITIEAALFFVVDGRVLEKSVGSLLFTHFGLSGPAAMNISRHIARYRHDNPGGNPGLVYFGIPGLCDINGKMLAQLHAPADAWLQSQIVKHPRANVVNTLPQRVPERLAQVMASAAPAQRMADLNRDDRIHLAKTLAASPLSVKGDRGFSYAEATAGGVVLPEINWKTMQSRKAENLFLCGEVLDVDGRIGGFNFQWAWASGYLAGRAAASIS